MVDNGLPGNQAIQPASPGRVELTNIEYLVEPRTKPGPLLSPVPHAVPDNLLHLIAVGADKTFCGRSRAMFDAVPVTFRPGDMLCAICRHSARNSGGPQ